MYQIKVLGAINCTHIKLQSPDMYCIKNINTKIGYIFE